MTHDQLQHVMAGDNPVIRVVLSDVRGSSPRDVGAEMFVNCKTTIGTIGGGQLEYLAIEAARNLLTSDRLLDQLDVPLGPHIGQCCGGRVKVILTKMTDADCDDAMRRSETELRSRPHVYIFGSGHVGRALAIQFQPLPFHTVIVDQRENELALCEAKIEKRLSAIPEVDIKSAPTGSAFIVLTHYHSLDFLLTAAALARNDTAYVGLIGSETKRSRFEMWARENGDTADLDRLVCPIGRSDTQDKRPEVIAAFVVAEVTSALSQHCLLNRSYSPETQKPLAETRDEMSFSIGTSR